MSTQPFRDAVANASPRPKGAMVSFSLYSELSKQGLLAPASYRPQGLTSNDVTIQLPSYQGNVFVSMDQDLDPNGFDFKLR